MAKTPAAHMFTDKPPSADPTADPNPDKAEATADNTADSVTSDASVQAKDSDATTCCCHKAMSSVNLVSACQGTSKLSKFSVAKPTPRITLCCRDVKGFEQFFMKRVLPDTGAACSLLSFSAAQRYDIFIHQACPKLRIINASGAPMDVSGIAEFLVEDVNGSWVNIKAIVSRDVQEEFLLSWHAQKEMGLLHPSWPYISTPRQMRGKFHCPRNPYQTSQILELDVDGENTLPFNDRPAPKPPEPVWPHPEFPNEMRELLREFSDVFTEKLPDNLDQISTIPKMTVNVKKDFTPFLSTRTTPVPLHYRDEMNKELDRLISQGVIERFTGTPRCLSPVHWVKKKSAELKLCLVIDLRNLNSQVERSFSKVPSVQDTWLKIAPDSKFFFAGDLLHAYYQCRLSDQAKPFFAFILPDRGVHVYNACPMGFAGSSDVLIDATDRAMFDLPVIKEVDDLLVQAASMEELVLRSRKLFMRLREQRLYLSRRKVQCGTSVDFAGLTISQHGCQVSKQKLQEFQDMKAPTNVSELRSLLGTINYLRNTLPDLRQLTTHLHALNKNASKKYLWTEGCQRDFTSLKKALSSGTILSPFNPNYTTRLYIDYSNIGLGLALTQVNPENEEDKKLIWCTSHAHKNIRDSVLPPIYGECLSH